MTVKKDAAGNVTIGPTLLDGKTWTCPGKFATLAACLDDAKAYATAAEDGTGKVALIQIQEGTHLLSSTYTVASGMQITGAMPRVKYLAGQAPDLIIQPNGGSWIDCNGGQCFDGEHLRGVVIERVGFKNFTVGMSFGSDGEDGMSQSRLAYLWFVGNACCTSDIALEIYNFEYVPMEYLHIFNVNTGVHFVGQLNKEVFEGANSIINDLYVYTYPKRVENGNSAKPCIWIETKDPAVGTAGAIDQLTFLRPQCNSFGGDGTGTIVSLTGVSTAHPVSGISMHDLDVEGVNLHGVYIQNAQDNYISIKASSGLTNTVYLDTAARYNTIRSDSPNTTVAMPLPRAGTFNDNAFFGVYSAQATGAPMRGAYYLKSTEKFYTNSDDVTAATISASGTARAGQFKATNGVYYFVDSAVDRPALFASGAALALRNGTNTADAVLTASSVVLSGGLKQGAFWTIDTSGNISAGGGSLTVYRCATAGTLPAGALTITSGDCGSTEDTGLRVK